jgi:hypothetical protein
VLHGFHSAEWFTHLSKHLPLSPALFSHILALQPQQALVYATAADIGSSDPAAAAAIGYCYKLNIA